jgi:hypothetical protein
MLLSLKELRIQGNVMLPLFRDLAVHEYRIDRADGITGSAVNALPGVHEHLDSREAAAALFRRYIEDVAERNWTMDAIDGTGVHAGCITGTPAGFGYYCNSLGH